MGTVRGRLGGIMAGLGFVGLFLYSALYYYGLMQLSSQEACIVNYLWPIHRTKYYGAIKNNAMEAQWVRKCSWVS